jgi:hypothetical protein
MAEITFEDLVRAAQKLSPEQKAALVHSLKFESEISLTREQAIAELEALRAAGAFEHVESLYGKYARPGVEVSEEELNTYLHQIGTEWQQELDDLADEN